jgi:hypothetical protein
MALVALAPAASARPPCTGDCDGSLVVTVDEIIVLANIALGNTPLERCTAGDTSGDELVTVDEIVAAVMDALGGCVLPPDTPTPVPTALPAPSLDVGNAGGAAGSIVAIDVTLTGGEDLVTASSNDIVYDPTRVRVVHDGEDIACTINPSIGFGTAPAKILLLGRLPGPDAMETLRVGLVSFTSTVAVPDGVLYTCEFEIDAGAAPGEVVLENSPSAITALGQRLVTSGADGSITVE